MSRLWIKICGITQKQDAVAAAQLGADAIGLVFYKPSPRSVTLSQASEIFTGILPSLKIVGLFVNPEPSEVTEVVESGLVDYLQFHGDESPEDCGRYNVMSLKAFRMKGPETLKAMQEFPADGFLLDAHVEDALGGTGATFNWDLAVAAQEFGRPIFLAGGLTVENVAEVVRKVQPFAVDVSSGVEHAPGKKNAAKMNAFVSAAKGALA